MKKTCIAAVVLALALCSCHSEQTPHGVMDTASLTSFLVDAYRLEGVYAISSNHNYDTISPEALRAYDDLLRSHGLGRAQVDSSLAFYARQPKLYADILDAVAQRLGEERNGSAEGAKPKGIGKIFR